jgi:hypothetical protein
MPQWIAYDPEDRSVVCIGCEDKCYKAGKMPGVIRSYSRATTKMHVGMRAIGILPDISRQGTESIFVPRGGPSAPAKLFTESRSIIPVAILQLEYLERRSQEPE